MTLARAALAIRRRWWIAMLGTVLTLVAAFAVQHAPGVYYQQVNVVFMWPQPPQNKENTFQYGSNTLIKTAGVVARAVSGREGATTVSETALLVQNPAQAADRGALLDRHPEVLAGAHREHVEFVLRRPFAA